MCCQTVSTYISTKGHDLGEKQVLKKGEPVFPLNYGANDICLSRYCTL